MYMKKFITIFFKKQSFTIIIKFEKVVINITILLGITFITCILSGVLNISICVVYEYNYHI